MSAIKLPEGTQTTSSEGVTIQQKDHGDGLNIQGTPNDDTIIGSSQGDWIEGSTGNDLIYGAGTGSTGYSHVDQDTVRYGEDLYVFNRSTNENVKAFDITTNADGSVSIIRNDLTGTGNISTDILYNISNIIFGDGENAVQVQLEQRTQIDTWGVDGRQINIMGGIANDLIQGQDKGDRLFGGDGNDIILGDAHQVAESSITAAGGHFYDKPLPTGGSAQNNFTVDPGTISTATFVGTNSSDSNQVNHQITASLGTASTLHFKVDGADNAAVSVIQGALGNLTDLTTFASEVSQARESGFEVTLWVEHTATINGETVVGAVLLDVIDSQNYSAGDEIEGGSGNDFIDGGLSGNQTEHPWENDNHARYSGKFENYDLKQINLADSSGSEAQFNDGTTIASWWVQQPQSEGESITTFAELRTILGLDHAQVDLAPGTYTVVSDQSGNDGIDLVSNVQWLNFDGDWQRIEVEINPINWRNDSEPSGDRYQGTVFSDLITGTSSYDEIQSHQGNDLILAGGGGDHINAGAGNDFIDGGASGSAYNGDRWRDSDEVRIDGSSKRYEITQQTQADVEVYWANNFTNHGQTFNGNQTYFLIEDLSPVAGNGSVLVTNVDRINFSDKEVWLDTSIDYWDSSVGNDVAQQPTQTFNVRGTQFSDTVDISSLTNGLTTGALWRVEFTGGAGDDVFIGDAMGSSVRDGAGNDLIIGGDSPTTLSNNDRWYGKDQVEFQGAKERYEIEAYVNGDIITDSLGNVVFNLTQLANGQITTADNKDHQVGSGISQVYVVRDTLPDRFDGDGINLLVGVEEIYFDGGHVNLIKEIYENTWEDPSDPNYVRSIEVQGTQFDDIINTEATGIANETGVNNRVSGNDGNDYITTGGGSDRIEPGRGNDFIDGGAPGTIGNKWDREDVVHFNANKTSFEIKLASEEETIAFWSEHFAGHSFTYNGSQDYYLVEDTNPIEGYGTNLVTNIGRLSFDNSGDVRLNYRSELEYWSSDNLDNLWIEGSQFSDVLISSDEVPQHTFTSGASLSFGMRGDDGDDVFIGGDEDNGIQGDGGNDLLVGYTSNNTYNGDDNAQYGNKFSRYEITTVSDGHRVYQTAGDANSGLIYDLSDFSNGNIATSDGTIYSVGSHEKAYVIRDTLSTDLGGDGIDLVIGMDKLQFDGSQQRLTPEVYEDNNNSVRLGNANFTEFDDTYDLSSGILTQQGNVVNEGHVDTYAGNDMVIGFSGGTKFRGGAGDDVFIVPDNYVNDDSGWWNENEIRFSGPSNRYDIETGYVAFNIDGLPSYSNNGSIDWSDAETAGAKSAIRITDTLENELGGEGTDYAIGVDRVYFDTGDVSIRVGTTANDQVWDFWVDGDFRDQYGDIVGEKIENAMEVRKIVGSRFNDVITADDDIDTSLPTGWTSINISQNLLNSLLTDSNPVLFEVTNNGNNLLETIPLSELDQNNQPTANLWVESATDATVLSSALLANPNDLHGLDFDALSGSIQLYISSNHPENSLSSVFAHFEVNSATDVQQTVNRGMNFLNGQQGDDILIGGNGPDKFSGGTGDDIMIGGGQDARSDQVEYSGAQSQYSFAPIWVKLNNDHQIIAESQTKIDESYQSATVITDTDTSDGGSGRDILIGIERANFNGDDSRINLVEETRFELRDGYYPGANLAGDDLVGFPYIKIKTADISETLSIQDIVNAYTYTPYHSTTDFGFNLTTDSFREVEASSGNDTLFGLATNSVWSTTSKGDDVFVINGVALKDLNITQGFDTELNKAYVEVTNTLTFQGGYDIGTNRLYDFEQIQINEPGSWDAFKFPLTLNPSLESGQWLGFDYASIEDSLFDDTIDDAMVASFGAAPDRYQGIKIAIRGGNDTIDISTGSLFVGQEWVSKWDINNGNDHISTGHGLDVYYGNKELYEYEVAYFLDANSNKTRDAGEEITLEQFRTDGVTIYDGANAKGLSGNSEISFADYQTNHAGKRLFTETGDFWSRDAGWFDYNDNYYVEIQHSVPDSLNGTGTDVLHDVEIFAGNSGDKEAILDILTGAVHLQGWLYPGWDGKTYDASLVTTNDVSSDLSALRPAAIPSSALGTVNLIDDATEVVYDFDPNRSTYWNLDLRYDGDDQHHTRLIGTDGNVTLSYGDNLYEAAGIAITKANADAIADGAPIASLQTQANNYAINNNLTFYTQDNVHLGPGNDIIDLRGEAAQDVPGGGHMQDNLYLDVPFTRLNFTYGELDSTGHIPGAESFFADFTGTAHQRYTRVSDKLADDLGGIGINYLLEADWITPDDNDWIAGEISSWRVGFGGADRFYTMSTPSDSLVATSQLSIVQAAIDASEISAVIVAPTQGDGVYIAMDHGFKVENLWQKDLLVIGADDASFSFSTIYVAIADDRSDLARDNYGNVKTYDYNDAVDSGFNLKSAVLMQDHIADDDGGYGQKILVDFEQVSFNNWSSEVRISHEYQTWHNENDGHSGLGIRGSLINEIFKFGAAEFTDLSANNIQTIDIRDSAGDDATIILSKQVNVNFYINEGDDYLYLNEELGAAQPDNAWYQASLEDYEQARFEIEAVSVVLNTDHMAQRDVNGQWILAHPTDANAVDAILITDLLQTGIDLGSNLLVGVERVRFSEMTINTGITEHTWTSDDGTVELRQEGTAFGERLSIKLNADGSPTDVYNIIEGGAGNDILIGGSNGDRLEGGAGDDILIGAGNGSGSDEWRNLDRAEYDVSFLGRLDVQDIRVGYNSQTHNLARDTNGEIIFDPSTEQLTTGYALTLAYQVTDIVSPESGGFGTDILIGMERISISNQSVNLGVTAVLHDWNQDGTVDKAEVRGSDFNNSIKSVLDGGDIADNTFLDRNNNIDAQGGDDDVYAGAGGDWIRLGTGNDFVDGGTNTGANNWGGDNNDQVRFSSNQDNYNLTVTTFSGQADNVYDLDGEVVFKVDAQGLIFRVSDTSGQTLLGQLNNGDAYVVVQDKTPSGELEGQGTNLLIGIEELSFKDNWMRLEQSAGQHLDENNQVQHAWIEGTGLSDLLLGAGYGEEIRGHAGDDVMVGAGGGDRFSGGTGNDIMIGGSNGTSGDSWRDLDRADYWQFNSQQATITAVEVGLHSDGQSLLVDDNGDVALSPSSVALSSSYQLVQGFQVTDLVADKFGGFGTDTLVGVERIHFNDKSIDLLVSTQSYDWNNDGVMDWTEINGTNMADVIGLVSQGGTISSASFMNSGNYIRSGDGDDSIFALAGGDTIRPEGGNDYINGGDHKDTVEFSGAESRYVITTHTFANQAIDITDLAGHVAFKILHDGAVMKVNDDTTTSLIDTLTNGQKLVEVNDLMPGGILGGEGTNLMTNVEAIGFKDSHMTLEVDRNLNYNNGVLEHSWINGTRGDDSATDLMGTIVGDSIHGNAGNDVLVGLQGNDRLSGGAGDDILWGDLQGSAETLPGRDEAHYNGSEAQFTITKGEHTVDGVVLQFVQVADSISAALGGEGTDTLYGIEALNFSNSWVRIGVELYEHADETGSITYRHYQGSQFDDTIHGSEIGDNITGGEGNDLIYGGVGGDYIQGGDGSDTIYGGAEGVDAWGNARVDVARFNGKWADYTIQHWDASGLLASSYDTAGHITVQLNTTTNNGAIDTLYGIERLEFEDRSMSFKNSQNFTDANGDGVPDWAEIRGTEAGETIDGSAMADVIYGDEGDDTLNGGDGNDQLSGDGGNDTLDGGSGQDVFGNNYIDTALYSGKYADYVITAGANNTWTVTAAGETDTLSNIEVLRFEEMTANLVGEVSTRDYDKDGIVDIANLTGTVGADTFNVNDANGFSASNWTLPSTLTSLDYNLAFGDGDDSATLGSGNDTIKDLLGNDTYNGGDGFDTLQMNALSSEWSITETGSGIYSVNQVDGSVQNNKVISNIEQVQFNDRIMALVATTSELDTNQDGTIDTMLYSGSDTDDSLNAAANMSVTWQLNGNLGNDVISGGNLDDRLNGGAGNDTLSGGLGHDIAVFGSLAEHSTVSQVIMMDDGSGVFVEDTADTPSGSINGYKVVSGSGSNEQTDYLIDIESIEFSDGVVSLVNTEQVLSSFSFAQGILETRHEQGTDYDDELTTSTYTDELTGGASADTFQILEAGFGYSHITDFEGLDSAGAARDVLQFDSTDDHSLFGVDVSNWSSTDAAGKSDIVANLLKMATFDNATGMATFSFAEHRLTLDNVTADDLSVNNIEIV